ncbi:hypothetical protein L7F22_003403 [Adiantum nelumboides]|nr:hypothetical protein [Adiantum nelumboides]
MAYQLKLPNHWLIHNAFYVSLLKPYKGEPPSEEIMEDPPEVEDQEEVLQPESILRHEDKVWLKNVESSYYTFDLPSRNYSGRVGRISLLQYDGYVTTLWSQSFSVQSDVGALRLDIINTAETSKFTTNLQNFQAAHALSNAGTDIYSERTTSTLVAHTVEGKIVSNFRQPKSRNSLCKQYRQRHQHNAEEEAACSSVASPAFPSDRLFREEKVARDLLKMDPTHIQLMGLLYPQPLVNFATTIQTCYLVFLMVWFAFLQLSISLVHKSIVLLEGSGFAGNELAEGEVFSSNSADSGAWHLCLTDLDGNEGYPFDSGSTQDLRPAGKTSLEEAWHVAEHYLTEALENDCQGVYFSYNCTSPQQEAPESALGRWNRDHAGRLIRQLWP